MIDLIANWNLILVVIGFCSVVAVGVFIERLYVLKKAEGDSDQLLVLLRQSLENGSIVEAVEICETDKTAIGNIIRAGLMRHSRGLSYVESAMETSAKLEIALLEKNARALSIISYMTPLLGLLGTVLGFIQAFGEMRTSGLVDITTTRIGAALEYALVTTAAGLVVAIPVLLAYNYIVARIETFVLEAQTAANEVVDILITQENNAL